MKKITIKKFEGIVCISVLLLILITPVVSSRSIQTSSIIEINKKEQQPLWGYCTLFIRVREEYGNPEAPEYRFLPNVTVYYWSLFKLFIPIVFYCDFIPSQTKRIIFNTTAILIEKTNPNGWSSIGGQCWSPMLLVYVEKEGYKVKDNKPFRSGAPDCTNELSIINFVMIKE